MLFARASRFAQSSRGQLSNKTTQRSMATVPPYATLDPDAICASNPCKLYNLEGMIFFKLGDLKKIKVLT